MDYGSSPAIFKFTKIIDFLMFNSRFCLFDVFTFGSKRFPGTTGQGTGPSSTGTSGRE